jgi:hypothetical protein
MIRLCKRIVAEQTRSSEADTCVGERAVWQGVRVFSDERAEELFGQYLGELKRINSPTFTISELSSTVFRISDQAARRKVQLWGETGIVSKIGEVPNPPNRPAYLFGVVDLRVGVAMLPGVDVQEFLYYNAFECPSCGAISVTNRDEIVCPKCATQFDASPDRALLGRVIEGETTGRLFD